MLLCQMRTVIISEEDNGMNAFTVLIIEIDFEDESEYSKENYDKELTIRSSRYCGRKILKPEQYKKKEFKTL